MKRREFITLLGGAMAACPMVALGQQVKIPVVGYLNPGTPEMAASFVSAFRKGLSESGYVEGRNVAVEYRWANDDNTRLSELAADLIKRQVNVIVTPGTATGAIAAKSATTTIPIVFWTATDPVQARLVASFNRPGGNVTGLSSMGVEIGGKQLSLLCELLPHARRFALLANPTASTAASMIEEARAAASALGRQLEVFSATTNREIEKAFASLVKRQSEALLVNGGNLFSRRRVQLAGLAMRHAIPAIFFERQFAEAGGLMSYGTNTRELDRLLGIYAARILNGERPADIPVMQADKFELVINLQTVRTLNIEMPATLLARADEVIE